MIARRLLAFLAIVWPSLSHASEWTELLSSLDDWRAAIHAEAIGELTIEAGAGAIHRLASESEELAETRVAWRALAFRLGLEPDAAVDALLGEAFTLVLAEPDGDGSADWILQTRLDADTARRVSGALKVAPRDRIGDLQVFGLEGEQYRLVVEPAPEGASTGGRRLWMAPRRASGWLESAVSNRDGRATPNVALSAARGVHKADTRSRFEVVLRDGPSGSGRLAVVASFVESKGARGARWRYAAAREGAPGPRRPEGFDAAHEAVRSARAHVLEDREALMRWTGWPLWLGGLGESVRRTVPAVAVWVEERAAGGLEVRLVGWAPRWRGTAGIGDVAMDGLVTRLSGVESAPAPMFGFDGAAPGAIRVRRFDLPGPSGAGVGERWSVAWGYLSAAPDEPAWWVGYASQSDSGAAVAAVRAMRARLGGRGDAGHAEDGGEARTTGTPGGEIRLARLLSASRATSDWIEQDPTLATGLLVRLETLSWRVVDGRVADESGGEVDRDRPGLAWLVTGDLLLTGPVRARP